MSFGRNSLPTIVTLVMVVAFGLFGGLLLTRVGYLAVPAAVGLPDAVPGLRVTTVGETTWDTLLTDIVAALVLVAVVASTKRGFWATWGSFVLGMLLADLLRAAHTAFVAGEGLTGYLGYLAGGLAAGLLWGILLGWLPGLAALPRRRAVRQAGGRDEEQLPAGINSMG
ncbi:hypothetical protein OIE66_32245 [Nonomuraea sp. NBC_01738]|uniref:hypothetical protein n=1 Tax=Nonomuraea sp. NBC_01738 TaxID=2976003 RepID=UPI002E0DC92B|nr:hypothetical protein OIE66_32245 [Nonomuraea sp. NBC_01738]